MKSFQVKGKETEELQQIYSNLEQYWDSLNPSKSSRKYSSSPSNNTANVEAIRLENNSPRYLMSMLQQDQEAWTNDAAAQEMLRESLEAIQGGRLKGRRLFESDTSPPCEVSLCYHDDEYEYKYIGSKEQEEEEEHHCTSECHYSSSSSSSPYYDLLDDSMEKDKVSKRVEGMDNVVASVEERTNRGGYKVLFGVLAFAFLFLAICMSGGFYDHDEVILVPT
ncbi:hypothetical protein RIF29_06776 [Crotalaria pallida]|uniref:Uncharacterized protein n=1 Tax=Crotalaria pallida TaxID=3830 RepID=A0AAN9PAI2_CROPI